MRRSCPTAASNAVRIRLPSAKPLRAGGFCRKPGGKYRAPSGQMHDAADARPRPRRRAASANRFCGESIVQVCTGGVKYQFNNRLLAIAATTDGQKPPTSVTPITAAR